MPVDAATQELITEAQCDYCQIPQGMIWYVILAALQSEGTVPTTQELVDEASCLISCVPQGMVPYLILQAIRDGGGGGGGGGLFGIGSPEGVVTASEGSTYLDTATNNFYAKGPGTPNTGWVPLIIT